MECQSPHFMGLFKMKKRLGYLNLGKLVHQDLSSTYVMHIMNVISKYHGHLFTSAKGLLQIFSAIVNFIDHHKTQLISRDPVWTLDMDHGLWRLKNSLVW